MNSPFYHLHFKELDSTQLEARRVVQELDPQSLTLVTCDNQLSGKGTFDKRWHCLSSKNFHGTFVFVTQAHLSQLCYLPQLLSLATLACFKNLYIGMHLKAPNDLMILGKKVGGILTETLEFQNRRWVLMGLGLNFEIDDGLKTFIDQPFTYFSAHTTKALSKEDFLRQLCPIFFHYLDLFHEKGFSVFKDEYQKSLSF